MKPKLIYVQWRDASFVTREWREGSELPSGAECNMESSGFLVKETEAGIYLAADRDPDEQDRFRYIAFIPRENVIKKRVFRVDG